MRSPLMILGCVTVLLVAGCTVAGTPGRAPDPGAGPSAGSGATVPQPATDALPVTVARSEVLPGVVRVPADQVREVSPDGTSFVLTAQGAASLAPGTVMIVDGIAGRKVTTVTPTGDEVTVGTEQASIDEIFGDLDVSFDGTPDPSKAVFGAPAESDGPAAVFEDVDPDAPMELDPTAEPTGLRGGAPALALPAPGGAGPAVPGRAPTAPAPACAGVAGIPTVMSIQGFQVEVQNSFSASCSYELQAKLRSTNPALKSEMTVNAAFGDPAIKARITAGKSGGSSSFDVKLSGSVWVTGYAGAANAGGYLGKIHLTWDLMKVDFPFTVDGVPFVLRIGAPALIEYRLTGKNDTVQATFVSGICDARFTMPDPSGLSQDSCKMAPVEVDQFLTLAPAAMVTTGALKVGLGLGTVTSVNPQSGGKPGDLLLPASLAVNGDNAIVTFGSGITTTGATSIGVMDCIRIDRQVALRGVVNLQFTNGSKVFGSTDYWQKTGTDYQGAHCPTGG